MRAPLSVASWRVAWRTRCEGESIRSFWALVVFLSVFVLSPVHTGRALHVHREHTKAPEFRQRLRALARRAASISSATPRGARPTQMGATAFLDESPVNTPPEESLGTSCSGKRSNGPCDHSSVSKEIVEQVAALRTSSLASSQVEAMGGAGNGDAGGREASAEEVIKSTREETQKHRSRREQEQKAKDEEEEKAKKAEGEQKAKSEAEQKAKSEAEQKAKSEAEQKAKSEAEQKAKLEEEEKRKLEQKHKRMHELEEKGKRKLRVNITKVLARNQSSSWAACKPLPGTGQVLTGSPMIRTTVDLRPFVRVGQGIRVERRDFMLAGPNDAVTLTVDRPWVERQVENASLCVYDHPAGKMLGCDPLPCTGEVVEGSPLVHTSCNLLGDVDLGDNIYINHHLCSVINPRDANTFTCSRDWTLESVPKARMCKKMKPNTGQLAALTCCVATTKDSQLVETTMDLRFEISPGDTVRIRTEEFRVRPPVTGESFMVDHPSKLESGGGLQAYKISACFPLNGYVGVSKGSALLTTSDDFRGDLSIGDVVEIGPEQYEVVELPDGFSVAISRSWEFQSAAKLPILKCPLPVRVGTQLSGHCAVVKGSSVVRTTEDLTDEISPTDLVMIGAGGDTYMVVEPQDATSISLNRPYKGPTMELKCYRQPRSEKQRALEELAKKKMMCQSIYCLAKIEEEERAIAFALPRALTTLNGAQWTGSDKKALADAGGVDPDDLDPEIAAGGTKSQAPQGGAEGDDDVGADAARKVTATALEDKAAPPGYVPPSTAAGANSGKPADTNDAFSSQVTQEGHMLNGAGPLQMGNDVTGADKFAAPAMAGSAGKNEGAGSSSGGNSQNRMLEDPSTSLPGEGVPGGTRSAFDKPLGATMDKTPDDRAGTAPPGDEDAKEADGSSAGTVSETFDEWMKDGVEPTPSAEESQKQAIARNEANTPVTDSSDHAANKALAR